MAISSDVGHSTDVHPKQKWIIGKRLSKIALAKTYHKDVAYSGPSLDYVNVVDNSLEIHFANGEGLKTFDMEDVRDVQIAEADKVFIDAVAIIEGNKLILKSNRLTKPRYVRYGYSSFTKGNLVNKYNLPASTFSNLN